jgi:predicted dehydrogenase
MMGVEHIMNLRLMPEVEITAIADPTPTSLDWAKTALGGAPVATFADADALVRSGLVDAVVVASLVWSIERSSPVVRCGCAAACAPGR